MAYAQIQAPSDWEGDDRTFEIVSEARGEPRFDDDLARNWNDFEVTEDGAQFEWRTHNDRVRMVAKALSAKRMTTRQALEDDVVARWLSAFDEDLRAKVKPGRGASEEDFARQALLKIGKTLDNDSEEFNAYSEDDYEFPSIHAARSLPLPPWAVLSNKVVGGPGSGGVQRYLVLDEGRTLKELEEWLDAAGKRIQTEAAALAEAIESWHGETKCESCGDLGVRDDNNELIIWWPDSNGETSEAFEVTGYPDPDVRHSDEEYIAEVGAPFPPTKCPSCRRSASPP